MVLVSFILKDKIRYELSKLENEGIIIEPTQFLRKAAPIVPVLKRDGKMRISGDDKTAINQVSEIVSEIVSDPVPIIDKMVEVFFSFKWVKLFSKLNWSHAYQKLQLDDQYKDYVIINKLGLFKYSRLHLEWHLLLPSSSALWSLFYIVFHE